MVDENSELEELIIDAVKLKGPHTRVKQDSNTLITLNAYCFWLLRVLERTPGGQGTSPAGKHFRAHHYSKPYFLPVFVLFGGFCYIICHCWVLWFEVCRAWCFIWWFICSGFVRFFFLFGYVLFVEVGGLRSFCFHLEWGFWLCFRWWIFCF